MSEQTPNELPPEPAPSPVEPAKPSALKQWLSDPSAIWETIKDLFVRFYALAILFVIMAGGYLAVRYLVRTVFYPPVVPAAMLEWQGTLQVSSLRSANMPGVEAAAPRSPMGHYHGVGKWFQPDLTNGCTLSGCHEPLPHTEKAKVPAFANFHATFLECQMCHQPSADHPAAAAWVDTVSGQRTDSPAILQLLRYLEANADAIKNDPASVSPTIVSLLTQSIKVLGGDALLDSLLAEIETSEPGSPVWRHGMAELTVELPQHARGEYRAKLAWKNLADNWPATFAQLTSQSSDYLSAPADSDVRKNLKQKIHAPLAPEPQACLACHGESPAVLDFNAIGYTNARSNALSHLEVARLMQQIRRGERFFIPRSTMEAKP